MPEVILFALSAEVATTSCGTSIARRRAAASSRPGARSRSSRMSIRPVPSESSTTPSTSVEPLVLQRRRVLLRQLVGRQARPLSWQRHRRELQAPPARYLRCRMDQSSQPMTNDDVIEVELTGIDLLSKPLLNKGTAFTESERDAFHLHGLLAAPCGHARTAGDAPAEGAARAGVGFRTLRAAARSAGHERDAVLCARHAEHRGDAAAGLHADGRRRLSALQRDLAQAARRVLELSQQEPHPRDPRQSAVRQGARDRGERRRAHLGTRRSGRGRHGHPDREVVALHRVRRHSSGADAAGAARCGHERPGPT